MTSPTGEIPAVHRYRLFPAPAGALSKLQLVAPVASGLYGGLGSKLLITSNHGPSLAAVAGTPGVCVAALEGGGYPPAVAAAFDRLRVADLEQLLGDELAGREQNTTLLVPRSIARAWKWTADQPRLGCRVQIVPDARPLDSKPASAFPPVLLRLLAAVWLALGQLFLMAVPAAVISPAALVWVAPSLLFLSMLLAVAWPILPCCGLVKGTVLGLICGLGLAIPSLLSWSPAGLRVPLLAPIGVLMMCAWLGITLMGARSNTN